MAFEYAAPNRRGRSDQSGYYYSGRVVAMMFSGGGIQSRRIPVLARNPDSINVWGFVNRDGRFVSVYDEKRGELSKSKQTLIVYPNGRKTIEEVLADERGIKPIEIALESFIGSQRSSVGNLFYEELAPNNKGTLDIKITRRER